MQDDDDAWGGPPEPFETPDQVGETYPVEAFPESLAEAATAIAEKTQAPLGLACQSVLAAAAIAGQAQANVWTPVTRTVPLDLFLLTSARSGERKSSVNRLAMAPIQAFQDAAHAQYRRDCESYNADEAARLKSRRKKSAEDPPIDPTPPRAQRLLVQDPTIESLKRIAFENHSLGFVTDEAIEFIGGHSMRAESMHKTFGSLSKFWDGRPSDRDRIGDDPILFGGERRLTVHFMLQPNYTRDLLGTSSLRDQGLGARFLVHEPASLIGQRLIAPDHMAAPGEDPRLTRYAARIEELLARPTPLDASGAFRPRPLQCTPEALEHFREFANSCELAQRPGEMFDDMTAEASKAAEQALRIAGVLAMFENTDVGEIGLETMARAVVLAEFYLGELQRLLDHAVASKQERLAQVLWEWLVPHAQARGRFISIRTIQQNGPRACRERSLLNGLLERLIALQRLRPVQGVEIKGRFARWAYEVRALDAR